MDASYQPVRAQSLWRRLRGAPRRLEDRSIFHSIALMPLLAWVGLGGDGLSSSAYGPDEAFRALGSHGYLALPLALLVGVTVVLISACYMRVIERFPSGGGGYVVATHLLGPRVGVTAACALLVDYVLTVSVSIAAGADALFSVFPADIPGLKMGVSMAAVVVLVVLNLRGMKESIMALAPIFALFLLTHMVLLGMGFFGNISHVGATLHQASTQAHQDLGSLGILGMVALLARAYSMGAGTFTGIEAVSNGLPALREPRVHNGKRTMIYMAVSLALTAGGILICYLLAGVQPEAGKTLNAVLAERVFGTSGLGRGVAMATLAAEGALLFVAAQTGFMDGPRVMANMAFDRWIPRRFANVSDRLTTQNGVLLMGGSALAILFATGGDTHALVVMYSINVFLVFTLTTLAMAKQAIMERKVLKNWGGHLALHGAGLTVCTTILAVTLIEKFQSGGWLTLLITASLVVLCLAIRAHYDNVAVEVKKLDKLCTAIAMEGHCDPSSCDKIDPDKRTAVILVNGFNGLGIHTMASVLRGFPGYFEQIVFVAVALVDAQTLKDHEQVQRCKVQARGALQRYVQLARRNGFAASFETGVDTEVSDGAVPLCQNVAQRFTRAVFFGGKLVFENERWYQRLLHNENANIIQRRLQNLGVPMLVMPVRVGMR